MAVFKIRNATNAPVNVKITNAGVIHHHRNELAPGDTWEESVAWIGWDLSAIYSTPETKIDPDKDNVGAVSTIVTTAVGAAVAVAAAPFTGGASVAIALAAVGGAATLAGVGVTIASAVLYPATVRGLYGGDDYEIVINGGVEFAEDTVKGIRPLSIDWRNLDRGTSGHETAG